MVFFDGDGSISFRQAHTPSYRTPAINFVATEHFIVGLKKYINKKFNFESGNIYDSTTYFTLTYGGIDQVKLILDWIYEHSTPDSRMDRKYNKYYNYFYCEEYELYKTSAIERLANKTYISKELADLLRSEYEEQEEKNIAKLSRDFGVTYDIVKPILDNVTHSREFNESAHNKIYIPHEDKSKPLSIIAKENNMDYRLVRERYLSFGEDADKIINKPVDKGDTSRTKYETYNGKTQSRLKWSEELGINYGTLEHRLDDMGLSFEEALAYKRPEKIIKAKLDIKLSSDEATQGQTAYYNYNNELITLKQLSELSGVPKSTLDRRLKLGLSLEEALSTEKRIKIKERKEIEVGRAGLTKDIVYNIRTDYKNGIIGKASMEKYNLTKSAYIDIIGNRTWKSDDVFWK